MGVFSPLSIFAIHQVFALPILVDCCIESLRNGDFLANGLASSKLKDGGSHSGWESAPFQRKRGSSLLSERGSGQSARSGRNQKVEIEHLFCRLSLIFADCRLTLEIKGFGSQRFSQKTADFHRTPLILESVQLLCYSYITICAWNVVFVVFSYLVWLGVRLAQPNRPKWSIVGPCLAHVGLRECQHLVRKKVIWTKLVILASL